MKKRWLIRVALIIVFAIAAAMFLMASLSRRPGNLGVDRGRLAPCPSSPNCVCTQGGDEVAMMEPIPWEGSTKEAVDRLMIIIEDLPNSRVVRIDGGYIHAEVSSALFGFVDDVEFLVKPSGKVILFRSASRTGYHDLGTNRRRMEEIRERFDMSRELNHAQIVEE